jgi:oligosaccharyltransferase complex subunit beta
VPYKASDVQMEFVMLDPYVRKGMTHDNNGTFTCNFKVRCRDVCGAHS